MTELKPCPFCGTKPETRVSYTEIHYTLRLEAEVCCPECGCRKSVRFEVVNTPFEEFEYQFSAAIDAWNRRAKK